MEDPEADWDTYESYDGDGGEGSGKMWWVLEKGLRLGKRILVTGIVMTSAPIVLPPVLVISAIGFVCSVPGGFLLASYACTEKLLSKLLPVPTTGTAPSDMIAHSPNFSGNRARDDDVRSTYRQRGFVRSEKPLFGGPDFDAEENGQERHVGESTDREGEKSLKDTEVVIGGLGVGEGKGKKEGIDVIIGGGSDVVGVVINIEGDDKLSINAQQEQVPFEVTGIAIDVCEAPVGSKEDPMAKETTGLIEKMRDEGLASGGVAEEKQIGTEIGRKNANKVAHGTSGTEEHATTAEHNVLQNGKETRGFPESKKDDAVPSSEKKTQGAKGKKSGKGKGKGGKEFEAKKGTEVSNAGEATTTPVGLQQFHSGSEGKEGRVLSNYAVHKKADPLKITVSPGGYDLKRTEIQLAESFADSNKELYSEEQIWKQIDAMRKIVGCTTPRHGTCMEELKALYVFTGVEPPTSFRDQSDLVEINGKLRFLMSIVGVK